MAPLGTRSPALRTSSFWAYWGRGSHDVWAEGGSGTLVHFDGASCARVTSPTDRDLRGMKGGRDGAIWAVGYAGIILRRRP